MYVFKASYRRRKAWECLCCMRNMRVGLAMVWGLGLGNGASPPASATAARAQGAWSDHTELQMFHFWDSLRSDPQLPTHSCLLVQVAFSCLTSTEHVHLQLISLELYQRDWYAFPNQNTILHQILPTFMMLKHQSTNKTRGTMPFPPLSRFITRI